MKTNRFILAAIFGFALTFTFSCSNDDSGGNQQPSNAPQEPIREPGYSSNKTVVPSSSSKAAVQEYCVYHSANNDFCGVIEPIGSPFGCSVGTKNDNCPYGYEKINLDLLRTCVNACSAADFGGSSTCSKCGGSINTGNFTCTARSKYCRY